MFQGNFGSVELCRYDPLGDNTGEMVAVKKLQSNKQSTLEDFQKEINTLSILQCEYIVQYKGVCYSMGNDGAPFPMVLNLHSAACGPIRKQVGLFTGHLSMSLVMEYLPNGNLINYLEVNRSKVNTRRMLLFALQICKVNIRTVGTLNLPFLKKCH